jgi:hypothetical protein
MHVCKLLATIFLAGLLACAGGPGDEAASVSAADVAPPRNPALSNGLCPLVHCSAAQADAIPVSGPALASRALGDAEIDQFAGSPISAGVLDVTYPDGSTVFWVPKVDAIWKLGLDANLRLVLLAELPLPPGKYPAHSGDTMRTWIAELDALPLGSDEYRDKAGYWREYPLEALGAYYAAVDAEGVLYVAARDRIVAYADAEPGNPRSPIVKRGEYVLEPSYMNGGPAVLIGLNATFDGTLVAASLDGTVIAVDRSLARAVYHRIPGERVWNSLAVDEAGGVYVVTDKQLHKLAWNGQGFSTREEDGAWVETYEEGTNDSELRGSRGSGTTPVLLGSESDADQFVLIADASDVNNLVLYWRDEIPEDWDALDDETSPRVAGRAPVDFGREDLADTHSENSPVVLGYGAVVANGQPSNGMALHLDNQLWLNDPEVAPRGVQKFAWSPERREFASVWVRPELSVPNATPVISVLDRGLHAVTVHDRAWAFETLDWDSGETRAIYTLGPSQRFNPIELSLQLMGNGDPIYSTFGGVLHLKLGR